MILQITPVEAVATSLLLACVFVGVLYAIPNEIRRLPRDALEHVRKRHVCAPLLPLLECASELKVHGRGGVERWARRGRLGATLTDRVLRGGMPHRSSGVWLARPSPRV